MNRPSATDPPSSQNAQQQVNPLETILQVLSNVPSEIVLQEAATAKEATIDALITRFEDISSLLKQAKRQRKVKRKDNANDFKQQQSLDGESKTLGNRARMPTEVLRQLTQSGFLSTPDLAKMLLLTCKGYGIDLGRDYVYEHLCKSRWRYTTKLPPSLIADRGYYWLFRHLSRGLYESPEEEIPPPAFSYDEMLFSISIRDGSGKEIVSEVLYGEQLETLTRDGSAGITLEQPISIGTFPSAPVNTYREYADRDEEYHDWSVTVHFFRLDENKCCCVHQSINYFFATESDIRGWTAPLRFVGLVACTSYPCLDLEFDDVGKLLERRIQLEERDIFEGIDPFRGIRFEVHVNCFLPEQKHPSAHTVDLEFGEVRLMALRVDDSADDPQLFTDANARDHGVTLPHLLEHLKGWNSDE
jgi:hypothetical protein